MKQVLLIALLDKEWPPDHSFVSGMLAKVAARQHWLKVNLLVSGNKHKSMHVRRFEKAICLPVLLSRRGIGRFLNFLITIKLLRYQISRAEKTGQRVVLFVRNDPILLLAAACLRPRVERLVFQSSFPHEEFSGMWIKRYLAKNAYRVASQSVDAVTGVSPLGVKRISRYFPNAQKGPFIPLLSDFDSNHFPIHRDRSGLHRLQFIYIGAHSVGRELSLVLEAVVNALIAGAQANFRFVGGSKEEIENLSRVRGVDHWLKQGAIILEESIPRQQIPLLLSKADVGMSLIPPKPIYIESSPTKLTEYMSAGLVVLATKGIPRQEQIVFDSSAGELVSWDINEITGIICRLSNKPVDELRTMQRLAKTFAKKSLTYQTCLKDFNSLIGRGYFEEAQSWSHS